MHFYIIKYFTVIIKEEPSKNSRILISLNLNDSSLSSWESSVENLTITVFRSRPDIIEYPANIPTSKYLQPNNCARSTSEMIVIWKIFNRWPKMCKIWGKLTAGDQKRRCAAAFTKYYPTDWAESIEAGPRPQLRPYGGPEQLRGGHGGHPAAERRGGDVVPPRDRHHGPGGRHQGGVHQLHQRHWSGGFKDLC